LGLRLRPLLADLLKPTKLGAVAPQRIEISIAAGEHVGLGTGTQLSLALAQGLLVAEGRPPASIAELARLTGRGKRSGVGLHGFALGGLIHDGGRGPSDESPQLANRLPFPEEWRFLLVVPTDEQGLAGEREGQVFAQLARSKPQLAERLAALLANDLLPTVKAKRFDAFAAALFDYNRLAGEFYREAQGGAYSSPWITEQIEKLRALGVVAVGQSSWGPTLFAACGSEGEAEELANRLRRDPAFAGRELIVTAARNEGAAWKVA
jgi:beta-RFAP synthase